MVGHRRAHRAGGAAAHAAGAAAVIAAATLWNPAAGLMLTAAWHPRRHSLPPPIRVPELLAWAFLATWLLSVWRPISHGRLPRAVTIPRALSCGARRVVADADRWLSAWHLRLRLPQFLVHSIPPDHLIFSSPEPETWTLLQMMTGVAMLLASMADHCPQYRAR